MILLNRDPDDTGKARSVSPDEGMKLFEDNAYFNPHLLVNDAFKKHLRKQYISNLLERTTVYLVNTMPPPQETQRLIRSLVNIPQTSLDQGGKQ
jgi:hypothetical protein